MVRILSYSTQLSDHLKVREALKGMETSCVGINTELKIDSIFSLEIIDEFMRKAAAEGAPIHLILYNEKITADILALLPEHSPVICLKGVDHTKQSSHPHAELVFFHSLEDRQGLHHLVSKCLQMQALRYELSYSQSAAYNNRLSQSSFIEILGDHLNQAFVLKRGVGLVLLKFVSYGREPQSIKSKTYLLHEYYQFLKQSLPSGWKLHAFGISDLGLIIDDVAALDNFDTIIRRLHQETNKFFSDHGIVMSIDMGVALSEDKIVDPIELYDQSCAALSVANRKGHGFIEYYGKEQERSLLFSTKVESELKQVLIDRKLKVVYQPLVDLNTLHPRGVEALVRWNHPTLGQISPVEFLPIAERINGMNELADIVFHQAFDHLRNWKEQGFNLYMSVNIAGQQLVSGKLINHLMETLHLYSISPTDIELEVTEDFDLNYIDPIVYQLEELKNLGFKITIDDFGIGYSSLHYLSQFPVDKIKIDQSFIRNLNEKKIKILQAMCNLAQFMKIETLVEGIETKEQLEMLKVIRVQYGQGYLFSPPLEADKTEFFLNQFKDHKPEKFNLIKSL
ncbi:MAG: EAL domain-containing protein [Candidatus Paracaedibacteraceae bacterium]|nr:EAL domain-containing protein [Candidatus Paracaedibacteraceae bacterium]